MTPASRTRPNPIGPPKACKAPRFQALIYPGNLGAWLEVELEFARLRSSPAAFSDSTAISEGLATRLRPSFKQAKISRRDFTSTAASAHGFGVKPSAPRGL